MKMLKPIILACAAALSLTGCGGGSGGSGSGSIQGGGAGNAAPVSSESGNTAVNSAKKPVEIQYWYANGDKIAENNENLVKQFNESQSEVHVTAAFQGKYVDLHSKVQAAFAAGSAPEVTQNEISTVALFARNGMTQDMTELAKRDNVNLDDFVPGLMGNSYVDGKLYALPYLRSTPILYINATIAKEVGLDPAGPKNWQEFEEYARKMTVPGKRVGMTMTNGLWFYEALVIQSGGKLLSDDGTKTAFNTPEAIEPLKFWLKMKEEGILKILTTDDAGPQARTDFQNQRSGMFFSSTADLTKLMQIAEESGFELNNTFMPANKSYGVPTGGCNLVMISGLSEEKKEAAWKFIKWMTEKEQAIYASSFTGYLPSRTSALESDEMKKLYADKPQFKVAVDQLQYAVHRPMVTNFPEVQKIFEDQFARTVVDSSVTPEKAMAEAAEKGDKVLK
jgi:sn-glycerol 3-phosphate transport system substrate-binding protein